LPRSENKPAPVSVVSVPQAAPQLASVPVVMANVPMPLPAPLPKIDEAPPEKPTTIAGLIGNIFGSAPAQAETSALETNSTPVNSRGDRGDKTELAAKPKRTTHTRTAHTAPKPAPKSHAPAAEKKVANAAPQPASARPAKPRVTPTDTADEAPAANSPQLRTAFSAPPPASRSGLLAGAQPVVPVGTFDSRWSGLR
jgi:hypothetical protein